MAEEGLGIEIENAQDHANTRVVIGILSNRLGFNRTVLTKWIGFVVKGLKSSFPIIPRGGTC